MRAEERHGLVAAELSSAHSAGNLRMAAHTALADERAAARAERDAEWMRALRELADGYREGAKDAHDEDGTPSDEYIEWACRLEAIEELAMMMGEEL